MCVSTLSAIKYGTQPNGKSIIRVIKKSARLDESHYKHVTANTALEYLQLPCGQCRECRLNRSREWAMRCMHEASQYDENCFITLTFNDDNLDPILSLKKSSFVNFMKRLRKFLDSNYWDETTKSWVHLSIPFSLLCSKKYSGIDEVAQPVRYFHAGEYGDKFGRPHHHAILFGFDFPDKIFKVSRNGFMSYESPLLNSLWSDPETKLSYGFHEITNVTFETCAYVARYVCKKINGIKSDEHYSVVDEQGNFQKREPEFCTMSRRPGIGLKWYEKYNQSDVWAHDKIHLKNDIYSKPPRYYGSKYEITFPGEYALIKQNRLKKAKLTYDNSTYQQTARAALKEAQYSQLHRKLA